ncbi:MAG: translocation protein TolB [Marinoscillum sp.]
MKGLFLTLSLLLLTGVSAVAQYYHTPYGHNRIQYKRFDWYYYSTNNFEVYYYPGGQEYAKEALEYLEDEFVSLTDILGYAPYTKTKIFIYNSLQDLQQSNMGIGGEVFTIGGKTDFVKLQVELAYPGKSEEFKKQIMLQMSDILINDMMFGGSLAEIFQNSYLLSLPEWFIQGAARYLAYGWSQEMDDYVRDYLSRKKINKLVKIQNEEAAIIGQSIWNYIAIKYGRSNISNILNLTRIIRNEENSISSTLGITFKQFLGDWQSYYLLQREEIRENYQSTSEEAEIAGHRNHDIILNHVKVNANGDKLAYTLHKNGKYEVNVVDLESGKQSTVVKGGYLINDQVIDYHLPLIDWQDNHTVGVILYKRGYLYLNTYNVDNNQKLQKPLTRFRQVESFSFNDNGKLAIISGDVGGQNDLFLISMRRNALKRITDDLYDDLDPVFVPGSTSIVFSSNRASDSVKVDRVKLEDVSDNYNLFIFNLDTTSTKFMRLTNTFSRDSKPMAKNDHEIFYLSDQKGIPNLYKYNLMDSTFVQVSNFEYSIEDYDLNFEPNRISFLMLNNGRPKVYSQEFDLSRRVFTPQTARQRMQQAKYLASRIPKYKLVEPEPEPVKEEPLSSLGLSDSQLDSLLTPDNYQFLDESDTTIVEEKPESQPEVDDGFIDTDNYTFEDESEKPRNARPTFRPESFFSNYRKLERENTIIGPTSYEPRFSFNNLVTSFAIDRIRRFSILMETEIIDMLENHRLNGGVLVNPTNLRSGDVFGEYQFLKYWMDFHVRFDRNSFIIDPQTSFLRGTSEQNLLQKYTLNKIEVGVALPLTNTFRFELSPFYANTHFNNLHWEAVANITNPSVGPLADDSNIHFGGARAAMVLDNTIERGFNLYQGTRGIIEYENYVGVTNNQKSFSRLNVDMRHYQKIHRELTLATRFFYGRSMGNNPQNYLVGGMENWIFNNYEDQGQEDPLNISNAEDNSNILFTEFVTNLRGFDYNEIYGQNALLFNAELRLPVFRYFSNGPISSTFLRNFQMIGFYDVGTAWTGKPPFTRENSAFTKKYVKSNFTAELANFQNPWLASYGFGIRTVLLGYYLKIDVAKPVRDFEIGDTRIHLTLGLDF